MFWDSGSFYSSPLPYSVYRFSSAWFSSYVEGWLWTSYPCPGQEKGDVATPATPPTRKAVLYQKPLLPPQARCYLYLIGQQFVTFSKCQEIWGSKFIFLASLVKGDKKEGSWKLLWVSQPTVPATESSLPIFFPQESIISRKFTCMCSFHHLLTSLHIKTISKERRWNLR